MKKAAVQARLVSPKIKSLELSMIRINGGTQSRSGIDPVVAQDYSENLVDGVSFPPVVVFHDDETYWLADGFHRYRAYELAGKKKIPAEVRQGTRREAVLFSVGANAAHGLQRTRADKRRAVEILLNDQEWSSWSDREIARRCAVSPELVKVMKEESDTASSGSMNRIFVHHKTGKPTTMDTSAIGRATDAGEDTPDTKPGETIIPEAQDAYMLEDRKRKAREAQQAEFDRQREEHAAALPQAVKDREKAKADAIAARKTKPVDVDALNAELEELREANAAIETELATVKADSAKWEAMRVQFEQGGFDKVIAGKDEEIRVLLTRVETESRDKASWASKAKFWKDEALKLGWKNGDFTVDIETGEIADA